MYLAHSSRRVLLRLVLTGVPGAGGVAAIERLHERLGGELFPARERGSWRTRQLQFRPRLAPSQGMGDLRGYELHVLLHGVDADGEDADPCDVSGMRDLDGVLLLARSGRVTRDIAAGLRLAGFLEAMGYAWPTFPAVVALDTATAGVDAIATARARLGAELAMGTRPIVDAPSTDGVAEAVDALLTLVGAFVQGGRVRVVEEDGGSTDAAEAPDAPVPVRSLLEMHLYESLRACPCGATDFEVK
jgi:hypothetical protein